jgi:DNA polymerase III delta prime subunit
MYTIQYCPKKIENFVGNADVISAISGWLYSWETQQHKCLLLCGNSGIGKSLLIDLILEKYNYHKIEFLDEEEKKKDYFQQINQQRTFRGRKYALVIGDMDDCAMSFIKDTTIPILCSCVNPYDSYIKSILQQCFLVKMKIPTYREVSPLFYEIIRKEKFQIRENELSKLYENSRGDIRFVLNTLQLGQTGGEKYIQNINIFETTATLFNIMETLENKYLTYWLQKDMHPFMIHENYIRNTFHSRDTNKQINNVSYSADCLSDMELMKMPTRELESYVAFQAIRATMKCQKQGMLKFPQYISSTTTANNSNYEEHNYRKIIEARTEITNKNKAVQKEKKPRGRPKKV